MQIWSEDTVNQWRSHYDEAATSWNKWADQLAERQVKVNQGLLMAAGVRPREVAGPRLGRGRTCHHGVGVGWA